MRARWLKPDFFTDRKITTLSAESALVFEALWCWADDGGVSICDPDWLKAQVFFRWDIFTLPVISKALRDLFDLKLILVYRVRDEYFAKICNWDRHQNVHKPAKFRHPRPDQQLTFDTTILPPVIPGTPPGTVPASPPSRHLDTKTPRHLDGDVAEALPRETPGTASPKTDRTAIDDDTDNVVDALVRRTAERLLTDPDRDALFALANAVPEPLAWISEARASLDGIHGPPLSPRQLGEALREYVGNGNLKNPNFKHFRRYLETAAKTPESTNGTARTQVEPNRGRSDATGEAGAILARLRTRGEAEEGPDVKQAVRAIGGLAAVQLAKPERFGFVLRDFERALAYAREHPEAVPDPKPYDPPPEGPERPAMRRLREREETWLADHPGEKLPVDFHIQPPGGSNG